MRPTATVGLKGPSHLYKTIRTADHAVLPGFGIHEMVPDLLHKVLWHTRSQVQTSSTWSKAFGACRCASQKRCRSRPRRED